MEIQENMAQVIHALKEKRGQSLTELSEDLEISRSALQEYLAGTGTPPWRRWNTWLSDWVFPLLL